MSNKKPVIHYYSGVGIRTACGIIVKDTIIDITIKEKATCERCKSSLKPREK